MEDWLMAQRRAKPDGLALVFEGHTWDYAQLDDEVNALCKRLTSLGVRSGEVVVVHLANSPLYVFLIHALARLGATLVPINTRLALPEVSWQLEWLGCAWLISPDAFALKAMVSQGAVMPDELQRLPEMDFKPAPLELERLQAIVFTSGTAGKPKGTMLTFANHFWSAWASAARLGVLPKDRWLSVLPLYHVGGLAVVFRSCLYGTAISLHAGFDVQRVQYSLDEEPVTLISLVPTMLRRLLAAQSRWPESLRLVLLGGAAAPSDILEMCAAKNLPVAPSYGLTEAASQVATGLLEEMNSKIGQSGVAGHYVGKPLLFTRVRIVSEAGQELSPGEVGEIRVTGPNVMRGYFRDDAATQAALQDGELHTGDMGCLDADGDLWVLQRRSDLILSGGENVYPAEVEEALRQHPAVVDACVVGVPDDEWGQRVAAVVVLEGGASLEIDALEAFLRRRLAGFKLPRQVEFWESLPQTASGKVERREVADRLANPLHQTTKKSIS